MSAPADRRYLESHEWHKLEGGLVTIGITAVAAEELTDITFVALPKMGQEVVAGRPFGEIESVKATADLMCGVSGVVTEINPALKDNPALVNKDPYGQGWMIRVKPTDPASIEKLLSADDYQRKTGH